MNYATEAISTSTTDVSAAGGASADMKLEAVVAPVSEVDYAKQFYGRLGWRRHAHGQHEKRTGQHDTNWPEWCAAYLAAEQAGKELPQ